MADITTKRLYIISDQPNNFFETQSTNCYRNTSIVLQQQNEKAKSFQYNEVDVIHKSFPITKSTLRKTLTPHSDRYHKPKPPKKIS